MSDQNHKQNDAKNTEVEGLISLSCLSALSLCNYQLFFLEVGDPASHLGHVNISHIVLDEAESQVEMVKTTSNEETESTTLADGRR